MLRRIFPTPLFCFVKSHEITYFNSNFGSLTALVTIAHFPNGNIIHFDNQLPGSCVGIFSQMICNTFCCFARAIWEPLHVPLFCHHSTTRQVVPRPSRLRSGWSNDDSSIASCCPPFEVPLKNPQHGLILLKSSAYSVVQPWNTPSIPAASRLVFVLFSECSVLLIRCTPITTHFAA